MELRNHGLLRTFFEVLQTVPPQYFRLTNDRLWLADLKPDEDGATALVLQSFNQEGNVVLDRELFRIGAEEPVPYCWLTDEAVVLLHAPEDPLDQEEDKALTLHWFPYETLTENEWCIELSQLPGALSGITQTWSSAGSHTLQGQFFHEDSVCSACVRLEPETRQVTLLWAAPGVHDGEPEMERPDDGPDPEHLVVNAGLIDTIKCSCPFPDGGSIVLTSVTADEKRCRVEVQLSPGGQESFGAPRTIMCSGLHYNYFFPIKVEGHVAILDLKYLNPLHVLDIAADYSAEKRLILCPQVQILDGAILEVERGFAEKHLSVSCRNWALYQDKYCFRWWLNYGGCIAAFELPYLLRCSPTISSEVLGGYPDYAAAVKLSDYNSFCQRCLEHYNTSRAVFQSLGEPAICYDFDLKEPIYQSPAQYEAECQEWSHTQSELIRHQTRT